MPVDCAKFELIDLKHSYMKLSYNEYKRALLSLLTLFSEQNKKRILLAIGVCDDMDDDVECGVEMKAVAQHASRIRSDFFDPKRNLLRSMTEIILEKSTAESPGITPEGAFIE